MATFLGHAVETFVRATGEVFDRLVRYDFSLDQWGLAILAARTCSATSLGSRPPPCSPAGQRCVHSLTVQSMLAQNAHFLTRPGTYYFSYVTGRR